MQETEIGNQQEAFNISSRLRESSPEGQILSNLAHTLFELDGRQYESVEGFWQGLYFPEGSEERERVANLFGREAKLAGASKPEGMTHIIYEGRIIRIGSPEHHELMRRAIQAKIEQNYEVQSALLSTGNKKLTHILTNKDGQLEPDSKSMPADVFTGILMQLREELNNAPASIS